MPGASRPDCLGSESSARDCHTADWPCRAPAASLRPWRSNSPAMEDASDLLRLATGMSRKHHHLPCAVFGRAMKAGDLRRQSRSEEHTSALQSLMRNSYAVFCLKKTNTQLIKKNESSQVYTTITTSTLVYLL